MKVSPHFLRLYYKTVRRYKKLSKRLKNQLSTGQFHSKSEYAQREFLFELKKLYNRLKGLKTQLKVAAAAGVTALLLSTGSANAQQNNMGPFTLQQNENPLPPPPDLGTNISPTAADIDGDGDIDLLIGQYDQLNFY